MIDAKRLRVMWLLNHTEARKFEISMMRAVGVEQVFTPKRIPVDPSFCSASVDFSLDEGLCVPEHDLARLNAVNWYEEVPDDVWRLADQYFDVVFALPQHQEVFHGLRSHFTGLVVWRAYGLFKDLTYDRLLNQYISQEGEAGVAVRAMGRRFCFGEAYPHIADREPDYLRDRRIFFPLGLADVALCDNWTGDDRHIYFVCPEIASNPTFRKVYEGFRSAFGDMPYVVAGSQPIAHADPKVLGYVSDEQHRLNMVRSRVMFYHSQEPYHVHYHPFEAVRVGMPLVFMAGGMLDRLGGAQLPGRCVSVAEARKMLLRILNGDQPLIEAIRKSQRVLLDAMSPQLGIEAWRAGFKQLAHELSEVRVEAAERVRRLPTRRARVAVILPVGYRGGSLRGAQALAEALHIGSRQAGEDADIVFVHLEDPVSYDDEALRALPVEVKRRTFRWAHLNADEARRAMRYAGHQDWTPKDAAYLVPDDGMRQLTDCDVWVVISDRLSSPLLPLRPVVLMVYDYLQRYENVMSSDVGRPFLEAARAAKRVLVTTAFTAADAKQFAGVLAKRVRKVPLLAPQFSHTGPAIDPSPTGARAGYFLWTTNTAVHKNHHNAAEALRRYYDELDGQLACRVTGVNTKGMLNSEQPHLQAMAEVFAGSKALRKRLKWLGELPDTRYRRVLSEAAFLWHAGRMDNGTFCVVEAASLGVPSLSSAYPAMQEIDEQFGLNLAWMPPDSPREMAQALKAMERDAHARRALLPTQEQLKTQAIEQLASAYWTEVRACL